MTSLGTRRTTGPAPAGTPPRRATDASATLASVEALLAERLDLLEREWAGEGGGETTSADTVLHDDDLPALLRDLVFSGGKRLRPLMCHWGWVAAGGGDPATLHRVGAALELLHAFGLAQDDVMDGSLLRRGRPAVHVVAGERHRAVGGHDDPQRYGESVAVLVGDLAHAEADALVAGLPADVRRLWWRTSVELVRGQARDLSGAAHPAGAGSEGALERAGEVARAKSGAYTIQRPLQLGARLADRGDDPHRLDAVLGVLTTYGRHVGEAFALRDDLLGVFGDPVVTGKPASDDLRAAKATVLLALTEQRCTGPAAAAVARVRAHRHDEADVDLVRDAMQLLGVRADVEHRVTRAVETAVAALDPAVVHPDAVGALTALASDVAWRQQ